MNGLATGLLQKDSSGGLSFSYFNSFLEHKAAMPISNSLPLREEVFKGPKVSHFFDNLLPDHEGLRKKIAQRFGVEGTHPFDILHAIGRDCVGALQLLPESEEPAGVGPLEAQGRPLSEKEVAAILKNLGRVPLGLDAAADFRISIAGIHEKTALLKKGGKWFLPRGASPTSHILKPPIGLLPNGIDLTTSVANEWLCLQICERFGLPVPRTTIEYFEGLPCLVVERFDRRWIGPDKILRLPVEDFCQALGFPPALKYESDGGPGIVPIMKFLNASNQREKDRACFLKAQMVFQLIGAVDGHAKNFSVFLSTKGMQMAPLYDVLTIYPALAQRQLEVKEAKLAMAVGRSRKYRLREIFRRHWEETARQAGFHKDYLEELFQTMEGALNRLESDPIRLPPDFPQFVFDTTMKGIRERKKQLF